MKTKEQLRTDAKAFLTQFYQETAKEGFEKRWNQVDQEIQLEGSYTHTYEELDYGGKLARGAIPTGAWVDYFGKP